MTKKEQPAEARPDREQGEAERIKARLVFTRNLLVRDIAYHAQQHQEEVERTDMKNKWLTALRESLKGK